MTSAAASLSGGTTGSTGSGWGGERESEDDETGWEREGRHTLLLDGRDVLGRQSCGETLQRNMRGLVEGWAGLGLLR